MSKETSIMLPRSNCFQSRKDYLMGKNQPCVKCQTDKVTCVCHKTNILTRPSEYEETCFIFDMVQNYYRIGSGCLLTLKNLVTEVIYPFDQKYDFYRLNYNHRFNIYPVAIVRAHKTSDIINTITFCHQTGIPLRARGGAHCYQPASLVNFGIVLDQRPLDKIVKIDIINQTVQIQAGALLGPVIEELSKKNILIPVGTCVTNGLAGLTLGGGIGFALRQYGLTLDQIVEFKVVLANGRHVNATERENCDLYWALRGAGGGNFGIVTDFIFRYHCAKWTTIFTINYNFCDAKQIFQIWQCWAPFTDIKLTSELDIHNKYQPIIITGQLLPGKCPESDKEILIKLLEPLTSLRLHTDISIKTVNLVESSQYFGQGSYARPLFFYNKSDFNFEPLTEKAIDTIIYYMSLLDQSQTYHKTEINALGGYFSKISSDATAFPSREAIHWIQYTSLWDTSDEQDPNIHWLKSYYKAMRPYFPQNRKYVNALDYDSTPIRALKSYYGPNLPRLIEIKEKYDPCDFFHFEQSIPTLDGFNTLIKTK